MIFSYHLAFDAPVKGWGFRQNIAVQLGIENTRMVWLPDGEKSLMICLAISTEYRRVTDRQTCCHGIVRAMHTRRAEKKHTFRTNDVMHLCVIFGVR